jgi:isoleucyl-tRNA synthetase
MSEQKNTASDDKYHLNLFDTQFSMRAGLDKKAPNIIAAWEQETYTSANGDKLIGRYNILRYLAKVEGRDKFILHDGPPYANGELHIGHAVNKILKDIIVKYKTISGYDAPYIPGWDCHGLPIELNVEKNPGCTTERSDNGQGLANNAFMRRSARTYAEEQINNQKADFKSLGICGDWDHPYKTMDFTTEAATVKAITDIARNGYLQQGYKPVHWCLDCQSALAEAEVEYAELKSPSLYVGFKVEKHAAECIFSLASVNNNKEITANIYLLIWTTTTYTLPGNQAIAVGADIEYVLCRQSDQYFIVAKEFANSNFAKDKLMFEINSDIFLGKELGGVYSYIGFDGQLKPVIIAEHVTTDAGTGLVHTAPAHGVEDFVACKKAQSEVSIAFDYSSPIGQDGYYIGKWQTRLMPYNNEHLVHIKDIADDNTNKKSKKNLENPILNFLRNNNDHTTSPVLLNITETSHRATICWRHKTPLITMATAQWFIELDKKNKTHNHLTIRELAIKVIKEEIQFAPSWGRERLLAMIQNRPDWCVSRQRNWGTPLPFIVDITTEIPLGFNTNDKKNACKFSTWYVDDIISSISVKGIDAWHELSVANDIIKPEIAQKYKKSTDTLDVWFDSGSTIATIVNTRPEFKTQNYKPDDFIKADLYLEGSDQHRGWFQSSLLISLALYGQAPYKQLLTHGFLVDEKGHKMSKSIGNIVSIKEANRKYGPEILRLWVASCDYSNDIAYSEEIMKRITDQYRRIRNTIRFFLSNLSDFNKDMQVDYDSMLPLDRYAINNFRNIAQKIHHHFNNYQFHLAVQEIVSYCSEDLGGFYLDVLKDRLYTLKADSLARRSAQTALYFIIHDLLILIYPILSFTADEAWQCLFEKNGYHHFHHNKKIIPTIIGQQMLDADDSLIKKALRQPAGMIKLFTQSAQLQQNIENYAKITGTSAIYNIYNDLCAMHIAKSPFNLNKLRDEGINIDNMSHDDFIVQANNRNYNINIWQHLLEIRSAILKKLEEARMVGAIGSSLQAEVQLTISFDYYNNFIKIFEIDSNGSDDIQANILHNLEENLKFIFIVSKVKLQVIHEQDLLYKDIVVHLSKNNKCVRCWHYHETVGHNTQYQDICERCVNNL